MKKKITKVENMKIGEGEERKRKLENGEIWIKPSVVMETDVKYNRRKEKEQLRKEIRDIQGE